MNRKIWPWIPFIGIFMVAYYVYRKNNPIYVLPNIRLLYYGSAIWQTVTTFLIFFLIIKAIT